MALRLIEMILSKESGEEVGNLLKDQQLVEYRQIPFPDGDVMVRILLDAEQNEDVLDLLEKKYAGWKGNRLVMLPVSATLPREEELPAAQLKQKQERIAREELYESIKDAAQCSRVFLAMAVLYPKSFKSLPLGSFQFSPFGCLCIQEACFQVNYCHYFSALAYMGVIYADSCPCYCSLYFPSLYRPP